jgi:hypothetical protein
MAIGDFFYTGWKLYIFLLRVKMNKYIINNFNIMIKMNGETGQKAFSISTIIITVVAVIIIVGLAFAYYFFLTNPPPVPEMAATGPSQNVETTETTETPTETPTEVVSLEPTTSVVFYTVPSVLPATVKQGSCSASSTAEPYRTDAYKCAAGAVSYDPCFSLPGGTQVICPMNPRGSDMFLIDLTTALPAPTVPQTVQDNWGWFVELEDGSLCSPYTAKRPVVDGEAAYYGSAIINNERFVLIGDLTKTATMWTAVKKNLVRSGTTWTVKSTETVNIKTVWQ